MCLYIKFFFTRENTILQQNYTPKPIMVVHDKIQDYTIFLQNYTILQDWKNQDNVYDKTGSSLQFENFSKSNKEKFQNDKKIFLLRMTKWCTCFVYRSFQINIEFRLSKVSHVRCPH